MKEYSWFFTSTLAATRKQIAQAAVLCSEFDDVDYAVDFGSLYDIGSGVDRAESNQNKTGVEFCLTVWSNQHPATIEKWWQQACTSLDRQISSLSDVAVL